MRYVHPTLMYYCINVVTILIAMQKCLLLDLEESNLNRVIGERDVQVETLKQKLSVLTQQHEQLKTMVSSLGLDPKQFSKSKTATNHTTKHMINDPNSSTKYRRRKETEKALTFIHGGKVNNFYQCMHMLHSGCTVNLHQCLVVW